MIVPNQSRSKCLPEMTAVQPSRWHNRISQRKGFRLYPLHPLAVASLSLLISLAGIFVSPAMAKLPSALQQQVNQGRSYFESGQYEEAIIVWRSAAISFANLQDALNEAMAWGNLSLAYQALGQWEEAESAINRGLNTLNHQTQTAEQQRIYAQALDIKGKLLQKKGQIHAALTTWQESEKRYHKLDQPLLETMSQINQAQAMQDLGRYPLACETLLQALALKQTECQVSDEEIESFQPSSLAADSDELTEVRLRGWRSLANVLRVIGNLDQAEKILQTTLEISKNLQLLEAENKSRLSLGNTAMAQANRYREWQNLSRAEDYDNLALTHYERAAKTAPSAIQRQAQVNQLSLLMKLNRWEQAVSLSQEMENSPGDLPLTHKSFYTQIKLAQARFCLSIKHPHCLRPSGAGISTSDLSNRDLFNYSIQDNPQEIETLLRIAEEAEELGDRRSHSYALGLVGRIYELTGEESLGLRYTRQALLSASQGKANDLLFQWQWQMGRLLNQQGKTQEALTTFTQAINTLQGLRRDLVSINPEVQFTFRESIDPLYRHYVTLLLQPQDQQPVSPDKLALAREAIDALQLGELENFFRLVCLEATPVSLDQLTDKNDPNAAIIYPIVLQDRIEIILKLPQQPLRHYSTLISDRQQVERRVNRLGQLLRQRNAQSLAYSQQIYDWLIKPIAQDLADNAIETLVFVPDGALRNLPWSVLHDGNQYLLEQYAIALTPGLQLLNPQPFEKIKTNALLGGLSESRGVFPPLPFVPEELAEIQTQTSASQTLLNQEFTSHSLEKKIKQQSYSIVHLATHGQFSSQAENTFILTWDKRLTANQLNTLFRSQTRQFNHPIELLILSACETVTGDQRAALGLAGVAIRAGVRSTLATLWSVNDQATALLMSQLYQELQTNGVTRSQALRNAQLNLLSHSQFNAPHFWGAYVLLGNWL